ncbi:MAG: M56 family metallopeptidase [Acidobacteriota bacterium]
MAGLASGIPGLAAGYLLKTTAVMALALLAAAAAKRRSAAFRHFILSAALIGLVLLPFLSLAPVGWKAPLLPSWMAAPSFTPAEAAKEPGGSGAVGVPIPGIPLITAVGPGSQAFSSGTAPGGPAIDAAPGLSPDPASGRSPATDPSLLAAGAADRSKTPSPALGLLLAIAWGAGLAALLVRLAFGLAGASRLTAQGAPLDGPSWRALLERFLALLPLRRRVRLKSHPQVPVPLTWGWRRPVVLFPDGAEAWSDDERSSALCHELAHVKRGDFLVMLLVRAGLALFWWNPLCWLAYRRLLKEQEIACDQLVLRAGIRPSAYAASLLAFRRSAGLRWSPSAALPGILGRSPFQERLAAILKQKMTFMEVKMKTKITVALVLVAAVALVGTARPAAGRDAAVPKTVLAETAAPAAVSLTPVLEARATAGTAASPAAAQEKAKEQEKAQAAAKAKEAEKAEKEKKVVEETVVVRSKGDKSPIQITISEGGRVKKLLLDHSVTITRSADGDALLLTPEGKEPIVLEGEPLRIEIMGGRLEFAKEGRLLEASEDGGLRVILEGDAKDGRTVYRAAPGAKTEPRTVKIVTEDGKTVVLTPRPGHAEGQAFSLAKEAGGVWTAVEAKPNKAVWIAERDEEMLKKIQALEEQVQAIKARKMDISALEESLKKLEAELKAREEKLKTLARRIEEENGPEPGLVDVKKRVVREAPEKGDASEIRERDEEAVKKAKVMVTAGNGGDISLVFTGQEGPEGRKAYERAVARLKQELPEGCRITSQEYDPETGAMTFKIGTPKDKKTDEALVRKLVDTVRSEIEKK